MDFESLVKQVLRLSDAEKKKLINILNKNDLSLVHEEATAYLKSTVKDIDFDEKWQESLSAAQFKEASIQYVNKLPWK